MKELLDRPWIRVLIIATAVAMVSFALRETASVTRPVFEAIRDVLVPVAVGFAIAYVVTPVVDLLSRWGLGRAWAAGLLFGVGSLLLVVSAVLVVPTLVKQGVNLSLTVFQGESWSDLNQNGRFDAGEPFIDGNHNGERDAPLLSRLLAWAEESQNRLKVGLHIGLPDRALGALGLYRQQVAPLDEHVHALLAAAREARPRATWPAAPAGLPGAPIDAQWLDHWPGPLASEVASAMAYLPESERSAWMDEVARTGRAFHERTASFITALRRSQGDGSGSDVETRAIRIAMTTALPEAERARALQLALNIEEARKRGQPWARDLLSALGATAATSDISAGNQAVTSVVDRVEAGVREGLAAVPASIGHWAGAGLGSVGGVLLLAIDVLLVPIYAFFLVLAMPAIRIWVRSHLPLAHRSQIIRIAHDIERVVSAFFRGRLVICLACALTGVLGFAALSLFNVHVPYYALFGVAIGLATAIPLLGIAFLIPAVILAMLQPGAGVIDVAGVVGIYVLVQGVEAVLIPVVMGREVELHPVVLIIALFLCGKLLGVLGLILAVPIAASVGILAREFLWPRVQAWADHPDPKW